MHSKGEGSGGDFYRVHSHREGVDPIQIERTRRQLTTYGGLLAFRLFLEKSNILDTLASSCPEQPGSNRGYSSRDLLVTWFALLALGGKRFADVSQLRMDPGAAKALGLQRGIPGEDSIRRFLEDIVEKSGIEGARSWIHQSYQWLWKGMAKMGPLLLDWDSTVVTRFGHQEGAEVGYNPHKPGRPSHHPLVASLAGTRLCPMIQMRPGNTGSSAGWEEVAEQMLNALGPERGMVLMRGDIGFSGDQNLSWVEKQHAVHYLYKLRQTKLVQQAYRTLREDSWKGSSFPWAEQIAESRVKLTGWKTPRRIVFSRHLVTEPVKSKKTQGSAKHEDLELELGPKVHWEVSAYVTDLTQDQLETWQVVGMYAQRADCENIFDELKRHWGLEGFCSHKSGVTELAALMTVATYNLWSLFVRHFNMESKNRKGLAVHEEAKASRVEFLRLPGIWVNKARRSILRLSLNEKAWERLKKGYDLILNKLRAIAPQWILNQMRPPPIQLMVGLV